MQYEQPELTGMPAPVGQGSKTVEERRPFEQVLWKAVEVLRGSMDVTDYKHVILGLLFLKYVSESFEQSLEGDNNDLPLEAAARVDLHEPTFLDVDRPAKKNL